jgi:hypothetical protein
MHIFREHAQPRQGQNIIEQGSALLNRYKSLMSPVVGEIVFLHATMLQILISGLSPIICEDHHDLRYRREKKRIGDWEKGTGVV